MSRNVYDLVIAGGGVAGLATAVAVGRTGRFRILVIDQHRDPPPVHKGEVLQPRTLEVLRSWGVVTELESRGALRLEALECREAGGALLGTFDYTALSHGFDHALVHYHSQIRAALLSRAERVADITFGVRVTGVTNDAHGRVTGVTVGSGAAETRVAARLVVAADGPNSVLRRKAGLVSQRHRYRHAFLGFDLPVPGLLPRASNFITSHGARILYPMPHDRARLYVQVPEGGLGEGRRRDPGEWRRLLSATCPGLGTLLDPWPQMDPPQTFSAYRALTEGWTLPGLVFLGEAAHSVHPMAGQGMNLAIIDAWTLAAELAAPGAFGSAELIDTTLSRYESLRLQQVRRGAHMSHRLAQLCTSTSPAGRRLARSLLRRNRRNGGLQMEATLRLAGLTDEPLGRRRWLRILAGI
uniref:Putative FAD-dependent monooxygenase n=1 Tax=Streptomyces argenteolus TaxID=67274 RepID=A9ZNV4_9ACTN|nr:putative FAD-dependent monooxygenase [Streptomyces argenteolus]